MEQQEEETEGTAGSSIVNWNWIKITLNFWREFEHEKKVAEHRKVAKRCCP